ncbi:MAG: hypothetical protein J7K51_01280 [Thermotogae bacterium]|nr:hypothetical protein [Thermotogota bacterium]
MVKRISIAALLLVMVSGVLFGDVFIGLEGRTLPPPEDTMGVNGDIMARVDIGRLLLDMVGVYFVLPVAGLDNMGIHYIPLDEKSIRRMLGVGLVLKPELNRRFYFRIGADAPILEWVTNPDFTREVPLLFGLGTKFRLFAAEVGVGGQLFFGDFPRGEYRYGDVYLAVGLNF